MIRVLFYNYRKLLVFVLASFYLTTGASFAQDSSLFPADENETRSEEVITLSELASAIEEEEPRLKEVSRISNKSGYEKLQNRFSTIENSAQKIVKQTSTSLESANYALSYEEINETALPLKNARQEIESLRTDLSELIASATEKLASLDTMRISWEELLAEKNLNPALKTRIRSHIDQIQSVEKKIRPALTDSLSLRKKMTALDQKLSDSLVEVSTLGERFKAKLFQAEDSSPLYPQFWKNLKNTSLRDIFSAFKKHNSEFVAYLDQHRHQLWLHIALTILISSLVLKLKASSFVQQAFPKLYDNPLVIIFTTTLLLSYFVYADADRRFFSILGLLLVPPLTFLFCDVLDKKYRKVIVTSAILLAIDQIRNCIPELFELNQMLLMIQLAGSAWVCFRLFKICSANVEEEKKPEIEAEEIPEDTSKKSNRAQTRNWIFAHAFQFLSIAFLVILFAQIMGYWQLTSYLEQNIYGAIYAGILLYAGYQLLKGFVFAVLLAPGVRDLNFVKAHRGAIRKNTGFVIAAGLFFSWLAHSLNRLGWYEQTSSLTSSLLDSGVQIGDLSIKLKGVLLAGLILWAGLKISRLLRMFLAEDLYTRREFDTGLTNTVDTSVHYFVLIATILAAISAIGVGFQNIALIAGALSVGIGFGLQNIVNNFVSGIILLVERPVQVGDLILVGDTLGNVTRIGIRSCTVKTLDDADIIFPNASLVTEQVVNWTHSSHRARISVSVGVAYGTDIENTMKLLSETVKALPFVLSHPEVVVLFTEFADSSLNFTIRAWVLNVNKRPEYKSELLVAIDKVLAENNITIPFPQRDVHLIGNQT